MPLLILQIQNYLTEATLFSLSKELPNGGQSGSNGGTVKLNASKQTLTGNISLDKLSTLTMKLSNSSTYTGTINAKNSAKKSH